MNWVFCLITIQQIQPVPKAQKSIEFGEKKVNQKINKMLIAFRLLEVLHHYYKQFQIDCVCVYAAAPLLMAKIIK